MSYGTLARELARRLDVQIVAYSNLPQHGGCILYLAAPVKRLDIEIGAIGQPVEKLAAFVQQLITSTSRPVPHARIGMRDGGLSVL